MLTGHSGQVVRFAVGTWRFQEDEDDFEPFGAERRRASWCV